MSSLRNRVKARLNDIDMRDPQLAEELADMRTSKDVRDAARTKLEEAVAEPGGLESIDTVGAESFALETIVLRVGRPVLAISGGTFEPAFEEPESQIWTARLTTARDKLVKCIPSVGRIEVKNHPHYDWLGTGWLIDKDTIVTNRHVASEFAMKRGTDLIFRQGVTGPIAASIDFLEEFGKDLSLAFNIIEVLHIEPEDGPDVALLRIAQIGEGPLAQPIELQGGTPQESQQVAVIGYPAKDSRILDQALMDRIFGDVYDKKRLAPGQITGHDRGNLLHDCSTLGGNSGSVLLDLDTGGAVGLHYAGRYLKTNYAVSADVILNRLHNYEKIRGTTQVSTRNRNRPDFPGAATPLSSRATTNAHEPNSISSITHTVPVEITVTIGGKRPDVVDPLRSEVRGTGSEYVELEEHQDDLEGRPEDYDDRQGYMPNFLGAEFGIDLPSPNTEWNSDILAIPNTTDNTLRYEHFSVMMNACRRMCFFSAVNINGKLSRKATRVGWRYDPRISTDAQIKAECYGNEPKFSRGHMTRREDPVWGSEDDALRGNSDSMHYTNAVPQMQPFNAGIWLGLENYALDHAREDDMKISVFTGPLFYDDDPTMYGIQIPIAFWKVIGFIHDETNDLCATGYYMSQEDFLQEEEFVFGKHKTAQVPIAWIEQEAGISFNGLADVDPLGAISESRGRAIRPLSDFRQIVLR